jgi:NitT/TauT family transport system substrate-binding protein
MRLSRATWVRSAALAFGAALYSRPVRAQPLTVRVGAAANEASGPIFYAKDLGFFDKGGLNVEIVMLANGAAIAAGMAGGSLEIGASNPITFLNARRRGLPYTVIAPGILYESRDPYAMLVVAATSPLRVAKDFNDKVIAGSSLGGLDELSIRSWLDQNGGDSTTVKIVELSPAAMVDALEQGRIAAAILPEPLLSAAGTRIRKAGAAYDAIAKTMLISIWFTSYTWAQQHNAEERKFRDAMFQSHAWAAANREKAAEILEKWTKIHVARVRTTGATRLDAGQIQPICDAALKYKIIDAPANAKDWIWNGKVPTS